MGIQRAEYIFCTDPNFVSSFHHHGMVYFFFRETAVENINCGKVRNRRVKTAVFCYIAI